MAKGGRISDGKRLYNAGVRVFIVLDVDGVLNSVYRRGPFPSGFFWPVKQFPCTLTADHSMTYIMQFAPGMIAELNKMLANRRTQLCWLTSWQKDALNVGRGMGLAGSRPDVVVDYNRGVFDDQIGKPAGLTRFMAGVPGDASVVWVDDMLHDGYYNTDDAVAAMTPVEVLRIRPEASYGISKGEMARIAEFVQTRTGRLNRKGDGANA